MPKLASWGLMLEFGVKEGNPWNWVTIASCFLKVSIIAVLEIA